MAITFTESIKDLGKVTVEKTVYRNIEISATRTDDVMGTVISASKSGLITTSTDLTPIAKAVGDDILTQIPKETAKEGLLAECKTDFHAYLIERGDIN